MIWWFYRRLKDYKRAPSPQQASLLRSQFDRIFKRRTGYATLDRLLKRLLGRKDELLRVLERPEIPLNTNASENDIRAFVTKRKISGGTVSEKGRQARDVMLGLAKTCMKLKIPFFDYLGAPPRHSRPRHPQPRNPRQPRPKLTTRPGICPGYLSQEAFAPTVSEFLLSPVQGRPSKSEQNCLDLLYFYSSESGLINGSQRFQIRIFSP